MVNLPTAKDHLNVTESMDDALIAGLIASAQSYAESWLGYEIAERYPDGAPAAIDQAQLMLIGEWYANRETSVAGSIAELPLGAVALLNAFRDYSWGVTVDDG